MSVSIIDGTIETAELKKSALNIRVYHKIVFRLTDGSEKTILKPIADAQVAALLQPGAKGRFYVFNAPDQRGVHGVRDDQGHAVFAFPRNNEKAMLIMMIFGLVISALCLSFGFFSLWFVILLGISIPFYFIYKNVRMEAGRQFEADGGYHAPAAAVPAAGA